MSLLDELMQIEHRLATGGGAEYREILADEARVIVPGAVLDKSACVATMDASPGWDAVRLESASIVGGDGFAVVVYTFNGKRGDLEYSATLASTYRLPDRTLLVHQQTPDG